MADLLRQKRATATTMTDHVSLFPVHILPAEAHPELEEGAVCHGAGQRGPGAHRSSAQEAREEEETGDAREGGTEDGGNTRGVDKDRKTVLVKERCGACLYVVSFEMSTFLCGL